MAAVVLACSYFTTVQSHSYTTLEGSPGLIGKYYTTKDASGPVALSRNDHMLSFHFLNYGKDTNC